MLTSMRKLGGKKHYNMVIISEELQKGRNLSTFHVEFSTPIWELLPPHVLRSLNASPTGPLKKSHCGFVSILGNRPSKYKQVQFEAKHSMEVLDDSTVDGFQLLLMTPKPLIRTFDHVFQCDDTFACVASHRWHRSFAIKW
ncbi:nucleolar protein 6 isoform 1-T2 [Macrochelys suwanniensis]